MKTILISLLCMILSVCVFGQDQQRHLVDEVEVTPPKFTGISHLLVAPGMNLNGYLSDNIQYPQSAAQKHIEGTEVVQFVIAETGEVNNFKVLNSLSSDIDTEVIRVLKSTSGMWTPGVNNGNPVAMEKEVSVAFKYGYLEEWALAKDFQKIAQIYFLKGSKRLFAQKIKKALRCYNKGINYMPNDQNLLLLRGLCHYELGRINDAQKDWLRVKALGGIDHSGHLNEQVSNLKGYKEMMSMLNE